MKIAVMGAGSMGSIIGALMSKAGMDVTLVDVNDDHVCAMNERGLKIVGHVEETIPVKACRPENMQGIYDLVVFVPKATANPAALAQLQPHLRADSTVITLQNGINEDAVSAAVGRDRACGGIIMWGATLKEPGVSELTSTPKQMGITIGEIAGGVTERILKVKTALETVCAIEATPDLMSHKWSKLYINAAFSGVGTVIGGDYGKVVDDDVASRVAAFVGMETIKTALALKFDRAKFMFLDPDALIFDSEEKLKSILNIFRAGLKAHRNIYPSMLQDLEKGCRCEIDVINGYIDKKAKESSVPAPVNERVTAIIRDIESGKAKPGLANLETIPLPRLP